MRKRWAVVLLSLVIMAGSCKREEHGTPPGKAPEKRTERPAPPEEPEKRYSLASEVVPEGRDTFGVLGRVGAQLRRLINPALPASSEQAPPPAPLSLTASDGTGLELVSMEARAVVEGPLAFTELHLTFRNPEPREIEGRFAITLPQKAAISRLAMKLPGGWQEAEVVERQAARRAYEDFLHRRQDPALMEKKAGNEFRARIFPIAPSALKEIKLSYSQQLGAATDPYRLPLRGLPKMQRLSITAFLSRTAQRRAQISLGGTQLSQQVIRVEKEGYEPDRDFEVPQQAAVRGLRHDNLVMARLKPEISAGKAPMKGLLVLVDTSASRAAGFASQVRLLGELLKKLAWSYGSHLPLQVTCFDQGLSTVFKGTAGELRQEHLQAILARRALGASDLHGALSWAWSTEGYDRLLLVTDGVITAGQTGADRLRAAVKGLRSRFRRMDAVLVGGIRDEELLGKLVRGTLERGGALLDGEKGAKVVARRLSQGTVSGLEVDVPGARWVWPSRLDGLQPDDEVLVFADLPRGKLKRGQPLTIRISGGIKQRVSVPLAEVNRPLLERAWVRARIERLERERDTVDGDARKKEIERRIVKLSTEHRVLCDRTALLVLETEADYQRYGINRRALADILSVGAAGIELRRRKRPIYARAAQTPDDDRQPVVRGKLRDPRGLRGRGGEGGQAPVVTTMPPAGSVSAGEREAKEEVADKAPAPPPPAAEPAKPEPQPQARPPATPRPRPRRARRLAASRVRRRPAHVRADRAQDESDRDDGPRAKAPPYTGRFAKVMKLIAGKKLEAALAECLRWRKEKPGDVLALVAMGEALTALGQPLLAARVYGSIIDLFPSRADMRRFAGQRLESLGKVGQGLAADTYAEAVRQRPDHPNSHRMLAYALVRLGRREAAFEALEAGLSRDYPSGRFEGVREIMREDLGLVAAAWIGAEPNRRAAIEKRLGQARVVLPEQPSLRFILSWETDANDVDFHIRDARGGHAFYSKRELASGGRLYADVTTGYGPECFAIKGKARAFPYRLQIHYYSRGPMGYGMGRLQIIQHDGEGGLKFEHRPFIVMNDGAYVDLGQVRGLL
jgi:tetratricopeptide (TPR) repeat protein